MWIQLRVALDFGSGFGKSEIWPFFQIRPNPAPAKFLASFGRRQCSCSEFS